MESKVLWVAAFPCPRCSQPAIRAIEGKRDGRGVSLAAGDLKAWCPTCKVDVVNTVQAISLPQADWPY